MDWIEELKNKYRNDKVRLARFVGDNEKVSDEYFDKTLKQLIEFNPDKIVFSLGDGNDISYRIYKNEFQINLTVYYINDWDDVPSVKFDSIFLIYKNDKMVASNSSETVDACFDTIKSIIDGKTNC